MENKKNKEKEIWDLEDECIKIIQSREGKVKYGIKHTWHVRQFQKVAVCRNTKVKK